MTAQEIARHPHANADSAYYWEQAEAGRLVFRRCDACGHTQFPPRPFCPKCWSQDVRWVVSLGRGSVHSFTIVRRAPVPALAARVPYVLAAIDLDDAPRMITNVVGPDALEVAIGDRVEVCFERSGGATLPQFRRGAAGAAGTS